MSYSLELFVLFDRENKSLLRKLEQLTSINEKFISIHNNTIWIIASVIKNVDYISIIYLKHGSNFLLKNTKLKTNVLGLHAFCFIRTIL